jgi:hypothetical protein
MPRRTFFSDASEATQKSLTRRAWSFITAKPLRSTNLARMSYSRSRRATKCSSSRRSRRSTNSIRDSALLGTDGEKSSEAAETSASVCGTCSSALSRLWHAGKGSQLAPRACASITCRESSPSRRSTSRTESSGDAAIADGRMSLRIEGPGASGGGCSEGKGGSACDARRGGARSNAAEAGVDGDALFFRRFSRTRKRVQAVKQLPRGFPTREVCAKHALVGIVPMLAARRACVPSLCAFKLPAPAAVSSGF